MESKVTQKVAKNSVLIMSCTFLSRLLGIIKARAIATIFGATGVADIINFTFNIPNNFRKLFAEGAMSSAYIPVFTAVITQEHGDIRTSKKLLANMQAFQLSISLFLIVITWLFREPLILFLSDFSSPSQVRLSSQLLVYFILFLGAISFAALYGGVLHSHGSFFTASAAPLLFSISVICSIYFTHKKLGAFSMALGVVVGGGVQAFVTWLRLRTFGYRLTLSWNFSNPDFKRVMRSWAPVTLTALSAIVAQQVAFFFASSLSEGSVTAFTNAIIIWQAPYGIFYAAIATVFFPAMVVAYYRREKKELGTLVSQGLTYIATFLIPAAVTLVILRNETTAVLLQSGRFTLANSQETGAILFYFALGMPIVAWYSFLQRVCFSTGNYKTALGLGVFVTLVDIGCMWGALRLGFGSQALSIANTIAFSVGALILWIVLLRTKQFTIEHRQLFRKMGKLLLVNIPLAVLALLYVSYSDPTWWHSGSTIRNAAILAALYSAAVGITLVSYKIFGVDFIQAFLQKER